MDTEDYCVAWRDNAAIHFHKADASPSGLSLFLWVNDVDAIYDEVVKNGAKISVEIDDREYGIRDFNITDPNGLAISFG